ncbi:MAG: hypothetical protein M3409_03675, partial [Gemmatimonadota bacterium]|nr:hypothetical protein [Gemmatimonadota bacterium]
FGLPGCTASGTSPEDALAALPGEIAAWLGLLRRVGERVPPEDTELEVAVDEWIATDADVAAGASDVCFAWDRAPLSDAEIDVGVRRLGDVRGMLLARIRALGDGALDRAWVGEWSVRRVLEELARAQWWTLSRLGASPLADAGGSTVRRLDTALALAVQQLTHLPVEARDRTLWLDDEEWTPRKVLRRLLWLEWSLARPAAQALHPLPEEP